MILEIKLLCSDREIEGNMGDQKGNRGKVRRPAGANSQNKNICYMNELTDINCEDRGKIYLNQLDLCSGCLSKFIKG